MEGETRVHSVTVYSVCAPLYFQAKSAIVKYQILDLAAVHRPCGLKIATVLS